MGYNPKENSEKRDYEPRRAKQQNLYHHDDYEEFSHLLTSQKEKTTQKIQTSRKDKLE